ncbi:MAG: 4-hydroxy-tetrahydrodipicolinate reductase [Pseudomonadota bacterium]
MTQDAHEPVGVGILGATGRMGRLIADAVQAAPKMRLAGLGVSDGHDHEGSDAETALGLAGCSLTLSADVPGIVQASDVVIDFTHPNALARHLQAAVDHRTPLVIGTTGADKSQEMAVERAAEHIPIILAANTSLGVNLLLDTVARVAGALPADQADIDIVEMHHGGKVDAPSGTALALGRAAAQGRDVMLSDVQRLSREGQTGVRPVGEIGFATLRGGDVVGEHTVVFAMAGERIEITHRCTNRAVFARGAVRAAQWLMGQDPGLHTMADVLGLTD